MHRGTTGIVYHLCENVLVIVGFIPISFNPISSNKMYTYPTLSKIEISDLHGNEIVLQLIQNMKQFKQLKLSPNVYSFYMFGEAVVTRLILFFIIICLFSCSLYFLLLLIDSPPAASGLSSATPQHCCSCRDHPGKNIPYTHEI